MFLEVFNKIDKTNNTNKQNKEKENEKKTFYVSAKTGRGINELLNKIYEHVVFRIDKIEKEDYFFSNERQKSDLKKALLSLKSASKEKDEEIIAEYLRAATNSLERILGKIDVEEVLGNIFSTFCIGK